MFMRAHNEHACQNPANIVFSWLCPCLVTMWMIVQFGFVHFHRVCWYGVAVAIPSKEKEGAVRKTIGGRKFGNCYK